MKQSGLVIENGWSVVENEYNMETEPNTATLFTTGNGYIGVRGSFEEFGSLRIQGCYVRGLIDRIYELIQPFTDNIYMKKFYFDEEKLRHFEKQDSIINFADILLVRIKIGGETFYPWEGKILSWKRTLDMKNACLTRDVRWENSKGHITAIRFERFSSFDDDHIYCCRITVSPENHNERIEIISGLDLATKTNGQRTTKALESELDGNRIFHSNLSGEAYKFTYYTGVCNNFYISKSNTLCAWDGINNGEILANTISFQSEMGESYVLEKKIYVITSRDTGDDMRGLVKHKVEMLEHSGYDSLFEKHAAKWQSFFKEMDIKITGDENADGSLRFSNYHSAISLPRNDAVHSLGAKGLTGETYNNFVWWDCEVYQAPIFFHTVPQNAKNILIYRYEKLDAARQIALQEGRRGARFPFTSSVSGLETVWEYVRHPFMQSHIVADVAWGVINYYICTGDRQFMLEYGLEILWEVSRYWASRVEHNDHSDRYEIKTVTGTDEHHPYVDNNAYTNYLVCLVLKQAIKTYENFQGDAGSVIAKISLQKDEIDIWNEITQKMYLPIEETGMIPQFDNYFKLDKGLEVKGGTTAKSFQMKESGLYHKSQVIKQPDVMLLFSYLNLKFDRKIYERNWDYYEARCEASSSLSYPVHSICASDMGQPERAYKYFLKSARLDLDDEHNCAWQGIHSACAAGAWLAVVRGVAGIIYKENRIVVNPHMIPWWEEVRFSVIWHGQKLEVILSNHIISIKSLESNSMMVPLEFQGQIKELPAGHELNLNISLKFQTSDLHNFVYE